MGPGPTTEWRKLRYGMFDVPIRWAGRGRPVLYLHDAWGALEPWDPEGHLAQLAQRYLVIAPSHPGFDGASGLEHLDDVLDLALYYLDFLDELLLDSPYVIGHGLGGMIAAEMASLAPQTLAKVVLIGPYGLVVEQAAPTDIFTLAPEQLARAAFANPADAPSWLIGDASSERRQANLAAAAKFLQPTSERGLRKRLHRLAAPTLLVWGEQDEIVPPLCGLAFHQRVRCSRLVVVPDAGHFPHLEQPAVFGRLLAEFLAG